LGEVLAMSILVQLLILAAVAAGGFWAGDEWRSGIVAARDLKAVQDNARVQILRADRADQAAERHEKTKTVLEIRYRDIEKEVERVVTQVEYRDRVCLADDGLRVAARAVDAANAAAGFPARAVSAPQPVD
jgi:hypothetical protein